MFLRRPLSQPSIRVGLFTQICRVFGPRSDPPLHALFCSSSFSRPPPPPPPPPSESPQNQQQFSGFSGNSRNSMPYNSFSGFRNPGMSNNSGFRNPGMSNNSFARSLIDSGNENEAASGKSYTPMDIARSYLGENDRGVSFGTPFFQHQVETDPDIVHVKLLKNNTFITVTDSKGNKKFGASAGTLASGGKVSRFAAESTAEHVGREARTRNMKSVVMKVNGFTYFKKKKQTILSFKEGYNHSRGDTNPVVYIEDTTRRPHNGCRLRKKRRI